MASVFQVKEALVEILYDSLNAGLDASSPERVDVFFGAAEADSDHPAVIVSDVSTAYTAERMSARSTLRRYDLTYSVALVLIPGGRYRTQKDAERVLYDLLDRVLTPLVRGDSNGESLLTPKLDGVWDVEPSNDQMKTSMDDNNNPLYPVLTLQLDVMAVRD